MLGLAERFEEGVADNRIYALQELVGTRRTGMFDTKLMVTLKNILQKQGIKEIDLYNSKLDKQTLKILKEYHDTSNTIIKKSSYWMENGGEEILNGLFILATGYLGTLEYKPIQSQSKNLNMNKGVGGANKGNGKLGNKLDYLFGKGTGNAHNIERLRRCNLN